MRSEAALRRCMQGLVVLNLAFVFLTGAADPLWLAGLLALTVAAPRLARFREHVVYRQLWNLGAVAFMGLLVRHALTAELAYVLQDGLTLAVLCQVHLLNNLRSEQQPDLLFFNAFLIAIVTGYLTRDLAFAVAFLAFAPFYVVGLQLMTATRGGYDLEPDVTRRLVQDGCRRSAVLLLASLVVFLFWPRDFERQAFFAGRLEFIETGAGAEVGFNERLRLERTGAVARNDAPALRVRLVSGLPGDVPDRFRGATLGRIDDSGWSALPVGALGASDARTLPWQMRGSGTRRELVRSGADDLPTPVQLRVERLDTSTDRLLLTADSVRIQLDPQHTQGQLRGHADGAVDYSERGRLEYELRLAGNAPATVDAEPDPAYLALPDDPTLEPALRLAETLARRLPDDAPPAELAALFERHLARTYGYAAPGADGAAASLDQFLTAHLPAHCEFFAASLGLMLRGQDIPARLVTGYRGGTWGSEGRLLTLRQSEAHVWVEAFLPDAGWTELDPTPATGAAAVEPGLLVRARDGLAAAWSRLTAFDGQGRAALLAAALRWPARALRTPFGLGLLLLAAGALALVRLLRRRREPAAVRRYGRALRACRLRAVAGETPRELLERARDDGLGPQRLERLERATADHERERFAA